jgi:lipid-A-disaccharide synthase
VKYYIIAGEPSGDLHASNLIHELKKIDSRALFRFWGGDLMAEQAGIPPVKHYRDLAFMGFLEVLLNIVTITKNFSFCKKDIILYQPDVLILVDYPGFNLRMASFAHRHGIRVYYYIAPTLWAWNESRIKVIRKYVDRMFVILPFEKEYYKRLGYHVDFVGHPLLDAMDKEKATQEDFHRFTERNALPDKPIIAVLPGSRVQEVEKILPVMLSVVNDFPGFHFVVAGISSLPEELYTKFTRNYKNVSLLFDQTYGILKQARAALVKSGTSTLETAILNVPEVVCYSISSATYFIAKRLAKVKYISMVNLIMDFELVKELIQHDLNYKNVKAGLEKITLDQGSRDEMLKGFGELRKRLGGNGASERLARMIFDYLQNNQNAPV